MVSRRLLIVGSGRMAQDVGLYFLRRGHQIAWLARDPERLRALGDKVEREAARMIPAVVPPRTYLAPDERPLPPVDFLMECVVEDPSVKSELLDRICSGLGPGAVAATVSSSILPQTIRPGLLGAHFIYPLELTGLAEVILPPEHDAAAASRLLDLLREVNIFVLRQTVRNAFALNRMLLPLQAECFRALMEGVDPAAVDRASVSDLVARGQLELMDGVGLDVVSVSVARYMERMQPTEAAAYRALAAGLDELAAMGKKGRKNRDGILMGRPLPWPAAKNKRPPEPRLFHSLAANTLARFVENKEIDAADLPLIQTAYLGSTVSLDESIEAAGKGNIRRYLGELHAATGRPYFAPASGLSAPLGRGPSR